MHSTMKKDMKKYLIFMGIFIALVIPHVSAAQTAMGSCPGGTDAECPANQVCNPDTQQCIADTNDGLEGIGGACSNDDDCRGASVECSPTTQKCVYDTTSDSAPASVQNSTAPATAATPTTGASAGNNFVPLTSLPGLSSVASLPATSGLPAFFNQLYKICIGVCAAIAFFQIIKAGVLYMSAGDNSGQVTKARGLITTSILGLVIVLSPYIVFSIINPGILSLNVNFAAIAPATPAAAPAVSAAPAITPANDPSYGDGTCNFECAANNICKNGGCVLESSTVSFTPAANQTTTSGTPVCSPLCSGSQICTSTNTGNTCVNTSPLGSLLGN
jgi:hypothetical protein